MIIDTTDNLLQKYRTKGVFIDANLLILYFIGTFKPELISKYKRTKIYSVEDFSLLVKIIGRFSSVITTPNILTEVSNLSTQLHSDIKIQYFNKFKEKISIFNEEYCPSIDACRHSLFQKYGLTDAVIMTITRNKYLVITDDFPLSNALASLNIDVINFNHIRAYSWK